MPRSADSLVLREPALSFLFGCLARAESCALVGLSNMGKSSVLRGLAALEDEAVRARIPAGNPHLPLFVYVDCNLMLEVTGRGFYEAILRALLETLGRRRVESALTEAVRACHQRVVAADNAFQVALNFNEAIDAVVGTEARMLVLLLDEFDDAFATLDGRVFLNLRALDDKHGDHMAYVTATLHPLAHSRATEDASVDEFCELFAQRTYYVGQLSADETHQFVRALAARKSVTFSEEEAAFVYAQAGGHPGLVGAAVQALIHAGTDVPAELRTQQFSLVQSTLDNDDNVRRECWKLWSQLSVPEQDLVVQIVAEQSAPEDAQVRASLLARGVLSDGPDGLHAPGRLLDAFVRRQRRLRQDADAGIVIEVEAGEVWVDGKQITALTDLEYRLLLLLYGRMDKLCDKFQIVENVWGQAYLDQVDDARIEKLISRLRNKIESDPANPKYLVTVRGRGYKLVHR